jgi:hypothetical protein
LRCSRTAAGDDGGKELQERIYFYELFQQPSLRAEQIVIAVDAALGARAIADLVDLPRLKIQLWPTIKHLSRLKDSLRSLGVLQQIDFPDPSRSGVMSNLCICGPLGRCAIQQAYAPKHWP